MGLNELMMLVKMASAGPGKGEQAMAAAAQIAAKPVGSSATIKPIEDPAPEGGPDPAAIQKQLDEKDKKIKDLERQNQIAQQNFDFQKMENEKMRISQQIRDEERKSMEKIQEAQRQADERLKQQQDGLDRLKTMAKAEEMQHKSVLQQQELQSQLKMQQDKNKVLMDVNNQGLKMQIAAGERARAQADKYKDEARKQLDKERAELQKYHQGQQEAQMKSREEQLKAREQAALKMQVQPPQVAAMSPALKHLMGASIKSLGRFKATADDLPPVGAGPGALFKGASTGTEANQGTNGSGAPAPQPPGTDTQQQGTPVQEGTTPRFDNRSQNKTNLDPSTLFPFINDISGFVTSMSKGKVNLLRGFNPYYMDANNDRKITAVDYVRTATGPATYDPRMRDSRTSMTYGMSPFWQTQVGQDWKNNE